MMGTLYLQKDPQDEKNKYMHRGSTGFSVPRDASLNYKKE